MWTELERLGRVERGWGGIVRWGKRVYGLNTARHREIEDLLSIRVAFRKTQVPQRMAARRHA